MVDWGEGGGGIGDGEDVDNEDGEVREEEREYKGGVEQEGSDKRDHATCHFMDLPWMGR